MTRTDRSSTTGLRVALVVFFSFVTLSAFVGGALAQDEADKDYWVSRYEKLVSDVEYLRTRVDVLSTNYTKMRQRNYPRGAEREAIKAEADEAEAELAEKEQELKDFPDEARRAESL